jgi:hypothetical protein
MFVTANWAQSSACFYARSETFGGVVSFATFARTTIRGATGSFFGVVYVC